MSTTLVAIVIAALAISLTAWDIVLVADAVDGNTISATLRHASREWPVLAYMWAVLGGHFFLGHGSAITTPRGDFWIVIWSMWLGFILNLWYRREAVSVPLWAYVALLVAGTLVGHFLWSQG